MFFFDDLIVTGKSKQILKESLTILKAGSEKELVKGSEWENQRFVDRNCPDTTVWSEEILK